MAEKAARKGRFDFLREFPELATPAARSTMPLAPPAGTFWTLLWSIANVRY